GSSPASAMATRMTTPSEPNAWLKVYELGSDAPATFHHRRTFAVTSVSSVKLASSAQPPPDGGVMSARVPQSAAWMASSMSPAVTPAGRAQVMVASPPSAVVNPRIDGGVPDGAGISVTWADSATVPASELVRESTVDTLTVACSARVAVSWPALAAGSVEVTVACSARVAASPVSTGIGSEVVAGRMMTGSPSPQAIGGPSSTVAPVPPVR